MKTKLLGVVILLCILSCGPTDLTSIKGVYFNPPYTVTSSQSKQVVWEKIIDLLATKGIAIKSIDKDNGILTSEKISFEDNFTIEDKTGKPITPEAYIVTSYYNQRGTIVKPTVLTGELKIRIKEDKEHNGTVINIKLVNFEATALGFTTGSGPTSNYYFVVQSTGKFEAIVADYIK